MSLFSEAYVIGDYLLKITPNPTSLNRTIVVASDAGIAGLVIPNFSVMRSIVTWPSSSKIQRWIT
jgi:hypothetical protein